jgi:hypothetical protein
MHLGLSYASLIRPQLFDTQTEFFNQKAADLTPNQVRDSLVKYALEVIEAGGKGAKGPQSKVYGSLREALDVKESPNGGNEATAGMKHTSECIHG